MFLVYDIQMTGVCLFVCVVGPEFDSTSPAFVRRRASQLYKFMCTIPRQNRNINECWKPPFSHLLRHTRVKAVILFYSNNTRYISLYSNIHAHVCIKYHCYALTNKNEIEVQYEKIRRNQLKWNLPDFIISILSHIES